MNKVVFYFIALIILLLPLEQLEGNSVEIIKAITCSFFILTLGVAHGAIDNVLYGIKGKTANIRFIAIYVFIALLNALLWVLFPSLGLISFLVLSAYHFGQSQLIDCNLEGKWQNRILFFSWGALLLSGLLFLNGEEIAHLNIDSPLTLAVLEPLISASLWLTLLFAVPTLGILGYQTHRGAISLNRFLLEIYLLLLTAIAFYLFSLLLGFTLYFILLHSTKVLIQEFDFLKKSDLLKSKKQFIKMLLPFTLLALVGAGLTVALLALLNVDFFSPVWALVFTSSITLPHAFVMDAFYKKAS
ncbi:MAG: Brp/Blh family beta-carotene 15,15'-dioxygenase [Salibacteraceae bacterium]